MEEAETINKDKRNKLSVLILTKNEKDNVDALMENTSFADEIIFVDAYSTDGTVEKIKAHKTAILKQNKFKNFSLQRNFALAECTYDWVLFLDADERITEILRMEIIKVLDNPDDTTVYGFFRKFYFKNKHLKYGGYQSDKVYRLFNRNYALYDQSKFVHETLDTKCSKKLLKGKLDHFSYTSSESYREKLILYAKLRAKELFLKKTDPNWYHFYIKPFVRFINHFILRLGLLDGRKGFIMAKLNAFGVKQRYIELEKMISKE